MNACMRAGYVLPTLFNVLIRYKWIKKTWDNRVMDLLMFLVNTMDRDCDKRRIFEKNENYKEITETIRSRKKGLGRIMKKEGLEKLVRLRHHICCTIFTQLNLIHHWIKWSDYWVRRFVTLLFRDGIPTFKINIHHPQRYLVDYQWLS